MIRESDFQDVTAINEGILLLGLEGKKAWTARVIGEVKPVGGPWSRAGSCLAFPSIRVFTPIRDN